MEFRFKKLILQHAFHKGSYQIERCVQIVVCLSVYLSSAVADSQTAVNIMEKSNCQTDLHAGYRAQMVQQPRIHIFN